MKKIKLLFLLALLYYNSYAAWIQRGNAAVFSETKVALLDGFPVLNYFAGTQRPALGVGNGGKIYFTAGDRNDWVDISEGLNLQDITAMKSESNAVIAAGFSSNLYWIDFESEQPQWSVIQMLPVQPGFSIVTSIELSGSFMVGGHFGGNHVLYKADGLTNWTEVVLPFNEGVTSSIVTAIATHNSYIYVAYANLTGRLAQAGIVELAAGSTSITGGIMYSKDNGITWRESMAEGHDLPLCLTIADDQIFAGTVNGIFSKPVLDLYRPVPGTGLRIQIQHLSWVQRSAQAGRVSQIVIKGSDLLALNTEGKIFYSGNASHPSSVRDVTENLPAGTASSLLVSGDTIFAGTSQHGIFKRPLGEIRTRDIVVDPSRWDRINKSWFLGIFVGGIAVGAAISRIKLIKRIKGPDPSPDR